MSDMHLTIDGHRREFIPLHTFRAQWGLPDGFNISRFEAKDWSVGTVTASGSRLVLITHKVIEAVPSSITASELLSQVDMLVGIFRNLLEAVNEQIGLRQVEIDFAADGFQNVLRDVAYQLLRLSQTYAQDSSQIRQRFDFSVIYQSWLDASARVFSTSHSYVHQGSRFEVRVVYYAYGRVGLEVRVDNQTYYVLDPTLACPAARYMEDLSQRVAQALCNALTQPAS